MHPCALELVKRASRSKLAGRLHFEGLHARDVDSESWQVQAFDRNPANASQHTCRHSDPTLARHRWSTRARQRKAGPSNLHNSTAKSLTLLPKRRLEVNSSNNSRCRLRASEIQHFRSPWAHWVTITDCSGTRMFKFVEL